MFRLLCFLAIIGLGYLAYDTYGYRYFISNVIKEADQTMTMGSIDPNINIVLYVDYGSVASRRLYPTLLNLMSSDPNVRVIIRPVETDDGMSKLMTRVALAAKGQDQFMNINNVFLTTSTNIDQAYVESAIRSLGLNYNRLKYSVTSPEIEQQAKEIQDEATLLNVNKYPFMFIEHVKMPGASYRVGEIKSVINSLRSGRR